MKTYSLQDNIAKAVWERFPVPSGIQKLINRATYDLYYGPYDDGEDLDGDGDCYKGFGPTCDAISEWVEDQGFSDCYFEDWSEFLSDSEPEAYQDNETGEWIEPDWDSIYKVESREIVQILVGKELAKYL